MNAIFKTQKILLAVMLLGGLAACHKSDDKRIGPAEQAGREIDQATQRAAVQLDHANDKLSDAARDTGDKLNKAAEVVGEKVERAGEKIQETARERQSK